MVTTLRDIPTFRPYEDALPLLIPATLVDLILAVGVAAFCVYAGVRLWAVSPGAVRTAKTYLYSAAGYQVVSVAITYAALPQEIIREIQADMISRLARSLIAVAVWLAYFRTSERVGATYGRDDAS